MNTGTLVVIFAAALFGLLVSFEKRNWTWFSVCLAVMVICGLFIYFSLLGGMNVYDYLYNPDW